MGEARRRKQLLGSRYGKLLGLSSAERVYLIEQNIEQWIGEHFENCEYHNYLEEPFDSEARGGFGEHNFSKLIEGVMEHFSNTFNQEYSAVAIKMFISAILEDQPIVFEGIGRKSKQRMEPIIALPEARKYFQGKVEQGKIKISTQVTLVKEALVVLGMKEKAPLLKQLVVGELNEVLESAQEEEVSWVMKNTNADGWINLTDELIFQSINRVMAGILTILVTLPWEMQLDFVRDRISWS